MHEVEMERRPDGRLRISCGPPQVPLNATEVLYQNHIAPTTSAQARKLAT
jgi:hypothetical protein